MQLAKTYINKCSSFNIICTAALLIIHNYTVQAAKGKNKIIHWFHGLYKRSGIFAKGWKKSIGLTECHSSVLCVTQIFFFFFVWKVLLYLNEILTLAQDMVCHRATGILSCYSESNWTKQQYIRLSESWDFQTDTEGCSQCIQIPGENPYRISHYLHMSVFVVQTITYLLINLIFFHLHVSVSYSRLWTLQEANIELL